MTDLDKRIEDWYLNHSNEGKSRKTKELIYHDIALMDITDVIKVANACNKFGLKEMLKDNLFKFTFNDNTVKGIYFEIDKKEGIFSIYITPTANNNVITVYKKSTFIDESTMREYKETKRALMEDDELYKLYDFATFILDNFEKACEHFFDKIENRIKEV